MCNSCGSKGFIEGWHAAGNNFNPNIEQCPKRCNISGYSNEVQRRLSQPVSIRQPVQQVMDFDSARPGRRATQLRLVR